MNQPTETAAEELAAARATNQRLNRRAQQLESELATYRRAIGEWELTERGTYIPLRTLTAMAKAAGVEFDSSRYEPHYARVERLEAELRRMAAEARGAQQDEAHVDDCPACQTAGLDTIGYPSECPGNSEGAGRG